MERNSDCLRLLFSFLGGIVGYRIVFDDLLTSNASTPSFDKYGLYVITERTKRGGCALVTFSLSEQKVISDPLNIIADYYTISQGSGTGTMMITNKSNDNHVTLITMTGM